MTNLVRHFLELCVLGVAGLMISWILQTIGHDVTLIEATDRYGGRAHTYYGDDAAGKWYGDLGAMRFPPPE